MHNLFKIPGIPLFDIEGHLRDNPGPPVKFVRLPTRPDRQQTWFLADKRATHDGKGNPLEPLWVCVHGGTKSLNTILRELVWISDPYRNKKQPWVGYWVIEADNASHAAAYLKSCGERVKHQINGRTGWDIHPLYEENINMVSYTDFSSGAFSVGESIDPDVAALQRTIERAQAKIDFLASLPDEPPVDEDGVAVIYFRKRFNRSGRLYDYAAIKAGDGKWYTTGPQSPKGYSWNQLIRWIYDGSPNTEILVATEWSGI